MNTTNKCKCGKRKAAAKPGCKMCWNAYLVGETPETYVPRSDGLLVPDECTPGWERAAAGAWRRAGRRGSPFREGE